MDRTSLTHPLQIASLNAGKGRMGVTFCPGKYDRAAMTGSWDRDLGLDLDAIAVWGASAVVTLVEDFELKDLRVEDLGPQVGRRGMAWLHLPIVDQSTPGADFERSWAVEGLRLRKLLLEGRSMVIHCKGGLGRAGTIAARLLIELGEDPAAAIGQVRRARPGAIETRAQEAHLYGLRTAAPSA